MQIEARSVSSSSLRPASSGCSDKFGGLVEIDRAAVAVDDLVFGPFDRGVEQIEVADVLEFGGPFPQLSIPW